MILKNLQNGDTRTATNPAPPTKDRPPHSTGGFVRNIGTATVQLCQHWMDSTTRRVQVTRSAAKLGARVGAVQQKDRPDGICLRMLATASRAILPSDARLPCGFLPGLLTFMRPERAPHESTAPKNYHSPTVTSELVHSPSLARSWSSP